MLLHFFLKKNRPSRQEVVQSIESIKSTPKSVKLIVVARLDRLRGIVVTVLDFLVFSWVLGESCGYMYRCYGYRNQNRNRGFCVKTKPNRNHGCNRNHGYRCPIVGSVSSGSALCRANLICAKQTTTDDSSHCTLRSKECCRQSAVFGRLGVKRHNGRQWDVKWPQISFRKGVGGK